MKDFKQNHYGIVREVGIITKTTDNVTDNKTFWQTVEPVLPDNCKLREKIAFEESNKNSSCQSA